MKNRIKLFFLLALFSAVAAFSAADSFSIPAKSPLSDSILFQSSELTIKRVSAHCLVHISYLQTDTWGKVPANGLVVINEDEAIVLDAPATNESARQLIGYLDQKNISIKAIVPTHFHEDCIGGLKAFHGRQIPSYAFAKTIELLKDSETTVEIPGNAFYDKLKFDLRGEEVVVAFMGEGHTKDNVIAYFPGDKVMFGGCLIKESGAGKGFLGDANLDEWPATIRRVERKFPETQIVIPGHGKPGGKELLQYTEELFKTGR